MPALQRLLPGLVLPNPNSNAHPQAYPPPPPPSAGARVASILIAMFFQMPALQRLLPGLVLLVLHHMFNLVWALPAMLFPAANAIIYGIGIDRVYIYIYK